MDPSSRSELGSFRYPIASPVGRLLTIPADLTPTIRAPRHAFSGASRASIQPKLDCRQTIKGNGHRGNGGSRRPVESLTIERAFTDCLVARPADTGRPTFKKRPDERCHWPGQVHGTKRPSRGRDGHSQTIATTRQPKASLAWRA
jgi:hypothetical protein